MFPSYSENTTLYVPDVKLFLTLTNNVELSTGFVVTKYSFGFDVAFDTKGTTVNYKRMEIKNPERLGKEEWSI